MKKQIEHWKICEAPICAGFDDGDYQLVWYPDEKICQKKPYTKWQLSQIKIQKIYKAGKLKTWSYFTKKKLIEMNRIKQPKGIIPDSPSDYALWRL